MLLKSRRLLIEPLSASHAEANFIRLRDPQLYRYIPQEPPGSLETLRSRYESLESGKSPDGAESWLNWTLFLHTREPVGTFQATVPTSGPITIAYMTFADKWGQGFAREAAVVIIEALFAQYDNNALSALIDTRNERSLRLVSSLGFRRVELLPQADFFKGASSDEFRYELARPGVELS